MEETHNDGQEEDGIQRVILKLHEFAKTLCNEYDPEIHKQMSVTYLEEMHGYFVPFEKYVNPLFDAWWMLMSECNFVPMDRYYCPPEVQQKWSSMRDMRDYFVYHCAWAIPSPEVLIYIAQHAPKIVECGCGTGYWARLLELFGVDVVAVDSKTYDKPCYKNIIVQDAAEWMRRNPSPDRALLICWADFRKENNKWVEETLEAFAGDTFFLVG